MSLAGWYLSFIVRVLPATAQGMVQCPLLIYVKNSVANAPNGTPLVPIRECHVFFDAPCMDSSLQIQPSISLATISLVFLGSPHVSQTSAAHFLCVALYTCVFGLSVLINHSKSWWFHGPECRKIPSSTENFFHAELSSEGQMVPLVVKQQCSHDMPHTFYIGVTL